MNQLHNNLLLTRCLCVHAVQARPGTPNAPAGEAGQLKLTSSVMNKWASTVSLATVLACLPPGTQLQAHKKIGIIFKDLIISCQCASVF